MSTHDDAALAKLPTGTEIHDALMAPIELDLVTSNIPLLREKYKGETPEQRKARAERYAKAIEEYDKAVVAFFSKVDVVVDKYKEGVMEESADVDSEKMKQIEDSISDSDE